MLEKFSTWFNTYRVEFTWFVIGWLIMAAIDAAQNDQWLFVVIDLVLAWYNFHMYRMDRE